MYDTIRRMLENTRPIDKWMLVIELLVLAVISAEGAHAAYRYYRKNRITKRIFSFFQAGQAMQNRVPVRSEGPSDPLVSGWNSAVVNWENDLTNFLKSECSNQAVASFQHYVAKPRLSLRIAQDVEAMYLALENRLDNLQSIMEKPEVYF